MSRRLCAILTKAITPYYYYAAFGLVLLIRHENRMFLIRPASFLVHILALILPFIFIYFANPNYLFRMLSDAFDSGGGELLSSLDKVPDYLYQALIFQPIQLIATTTPFSLIAIYAIIFKKEFKNYQYIELAKIGFLTFFIAFIPFWFSWNHWPEGRYYLPVIPALSIWFAYFIYNANDKLKKITLCLLVITLVIKLLLGGFGFYAFYKNFRPDYPLIAKDIIHIVKDAPLTVSRGGTAEGLGIASSLDEQFMPYKTVTDYTKKMPHGISYFVYPSGNRNLPIKLERNQHLVKAYLHKYSPRSIFLIEQINS